jgi:cobalt-zinc-cadmium resistance protein CzcA
MIATLIDAALDNRLLAVLFGLLLLVWGGISFHNLPVEAYPDVANNYVNIITQWPGRAAEEVEQQVTVPLESSMNGLPHLEHLRSTSVFGLSSVMLIFDDQSSNTANRQEVFQRLGQVSLPDNLQPAMGTDWSPVGQIYWYTLVSHNPAYDVMELKALEDWVLEKEFKTVPNVVDVSSFGGVTREYQVKVDPDKLVSYGVSLAQLEQQLSSNNVNAGGSFIEAGEQQINVRTIGLLTDVADIARTVVRSQNGTALRVGDLAAVTQGPKIKLGQIGKAIHRADGRVIDEEDVVEGIVLLRKGANSDETLKGIHAKVQELNEHRLPPGVRIVPFLDRSDLVRYTTSTVLENLLTGIGLVVVVLVVFLGNIRGAIIVGLTMPVALLFASICLNLNQVPANLLSLGALDFGMLVDGSVVVIENIVRHLSRRQAGTSLLACLREATHEVERPVLYARVIIVASYLPIFTLQQVEGRLFKPMAWTVVFALLGAFLYAVVIAPVLASLLFRHGVTEGRNPLMTFLREQYRRTIGTAIAHRWVTVSLAAACLGLSAFLGLTDVIGSEFLPHLDEGALWVRGTLAPSTGPTEGTAIVDRARIILASFPEATVVTSQVGRPDDGTDVTGFFNTEYFVDLKPKAAWRPVFHEDKDALIDAMDQALSVIPGATWGFSQPIADNMEEAVSGVKGELAVKIYGDDLRTLEAIGARIVTVMHDIPGVEDLGLFRVVGQPNLNLTIDRDRAARYQINVADVQGAVEAAIGGTAVSQVLQGERRYDLVVRYLPAYRDTADAIARIRILAPSGERVALAQLCTIAVTDGANAIYREGNSRYVALKYSVRDRDLGSTVQEAIARVQAHVPLPTGYHLDWAGEYASQKRSQQRLMIVVPVTLLVILVILYIMFHSMKWALLMMASISMAPLGGLLALFITGTHFSVSSGVGFLALFGVCVQTGVIMIDYINQLRAAGHSVRDAAVDGAILRLRPILMTTLVATLGLLPAALSHGIGSDSQRPFAIVIVGGLMVCMLINIYLLPTLYVWMATDHDVLPAPSSIET